MTGIRNMLHSMGIAALAIVATPADAAVFMGTDSIGTTSVTISVTTDGTLGTLTAANITGWDVTLTDPNPNNNIVLTPMNSSVLVFGDAVSATISRLTFDFGSGGIDGFAINENQPTLGILHYYCLDTAFACQGNDRHTGRNAATVSDRFRGGFKFEERFGIGVIASAPVMGGVPEPASWAMMIAGFGVIGGAARRRNTPHLVNA